jgi:hypothetical protein
MARHGDSSGEPCESDGYAFSPGGLDPKIVASIVSRGRSQIPAIDSTRRLRADCAGFLLDGDFGARKGKGVRL